MLDKFLPPTDNLYKFVAISGLLFIILSAVPYYFNFKLNERKIEFTKNDTLFRNELEIQKRKNEIRRRVQEDLSKQLEIAKTLSDDELSKLYDEMLEGEFTNLPLYLKRVKVINKLVKDSDEAGNEFRDITTRHQNLESENAVIVYYEGQILILTAATIVALLLGIALTVVGFYAWYVKVQQPNDLILHNQSKTGETEESE